MFQKTQLINSIEKRLNAIGLHLYANNGLSWFDDNHAAEDFFAGFFNMLYGYKLTNLNRKRINYPGIDIGDEHAKLGIQVTSDCDNTKVKNTIQKVIKNNVYQTYPNIQIFVIGKKEDVYNKIDTEGKLFFDSKKSILDIRDIIRHIDAIDDIEKIRQIANYIIEQVDYMDLSKQDPEQLTSADIKELINRLHSDWSDLLPTNSFSDRRYELGERDDKYLITKNSLNKIDEEYFKSRIVKDLIYNPTVNDFLANPINEDTKRKYFELCAAIQKHYEDNENAYSSIIDVFKYVFNGIEIGYEDTQVDTRKLKIILHSMYFNCDIGTNPSKND